jgi:predicted nucleic acid-binding Zn ribbon protein
MSDEPISPKMIPCKYCGQNIPETTNFCWYCGRELIARPERPESNPPSKMNGRMLLVAILILVVALAIFWVLFGR